MIFAWYFLFPYHVFPFIPNTIHLILLSISWSFFFSILYTFFSRTHNSQKIKNSKIRVQNKTQTLRKSYTFLSKAGTWLNINNNTNINNNNNNNNKNKQKIKKKKWKKEKKTIKIFIRHKGVLWKTQDCLIQRMCFQN